MSQIERPVRFEVRSLRSEVQCGRAAQHLLWAPKPLAEHQVNVSGCGMTNDVAVIITEPAVWVLEFGV